ncbi:hypothetical protein SCH01S_39_00150 [Sphingomonas changbaiensis NBRC 104936]|uniref:Uncharacterized protein n=1 Tax=Sphingomonas changbaiensis NBRC 104936 TaxID=1219043 RepID=A0A0E9MRG1_9SPHN|nr:hypothetical protein [Sphingomonas changbaiensis]GAO39730.1 hypothetical protein SCH01S_39_00150 [Sphingomonas changbaiensis NBRC 104936]
MLRVAVILAVALGLLGCLVAIVTTAIPFWGPAVWLAIALLLMLLERRAYKSPEAGVPGPPWQATAERFVDPETHLPVRVYFNPETGERRYVADGDERT